jgi:hypothetical protein
MHSRVACSGSEAEGQVVRAEGLAKSRSIIATSLEENIKTIAGSGAHVDSVMNLLMAINRVDALREVGRSGNLILMDIQDPAGGIQASVLKQVKDLSKQLGQLRVAGELSSSATPEQGPAVAGASAGVVEAEDEEADA